jgi:hypothetical protein
MRATNPRLTNGVKLVSSGSGPTPCQTLAACAAVPDAEILYNSSTSANGCSQIWSMSETGTNKTNISSEIMANIGTSIINASTNQGNPKYSPNGLWTMISYQETGSAYACNTHAVAPGAATDYGILVCDAATYTNCAAVYTVALGTGHGALHPQWSQDGTKIFWGDWNADTDIQEGNSGYLAYATFTAGTSPSIGSITRVDPFGDGSGHANWYEPWDSNGWNGGTTCVFYFTTDIIENSHTYANVGLGWYNICTGASGIVSTPYEPNATIGGSVTTTATQATVGATTIVVASATGLVTGQIVAGTGIAPNTLIAGDGISGTTVTITQGTTAALSGTPLTFTTGCYSEFIAFTPAHPDVALTVTGCPYAGAAWADPGYSVLDVAMFQGQSGYGMQALTQYNVAGAPEFEYPAEASSPRWSADGSYIVFVVLPNSTLQGQLGGYAGAGSPQIWKYDVALVPTQVTGTTSKNGQSEYK